MPSHGFLLAPAIQRFRSMVPGHNATLWIMDDNGIVSQRYQVSLRPDDLPLPHQLLLHLFLPGDIGPNAHPLDEMVIGVPHGNPTHQDDPRDSIHPLDAALHFIDQSYRKRLDACPVELFSVIGMNRREPASTKRLGCCLTSKGLPGRTGFLDQALGGRDPEQIGRGGSGGTEAIFIQASCLLLLRKPHGFLGVCSVVRGSRKLPWMVLHTLTFLA